LDAVIVFDGNELDGYIAKDVTEGSYDFTVEHPDYHPISETIIINEPMTINVPMTPKVGINE
jgi:hypothetical protein